MKRLLILILLFALPFVFTAQTPKKTSQKAKTSTQNNAKTKGKAATKKTATPKPIKKVEKN